MALQGQFTQGVRRAAIYAGAHPTIVDRVLQQNVLYVVVNARVWFSVDSTYIGRKVIVEAGGFYGEGGDPAATLVADR